MYPHYKFQMVTVVILALGYVPKCLEMYIYQLGFNKFETEKLVWKSKWRCLQNLSASDTLRAAESSSAFMILKTAQETYRNLINLFEINQYKTYIT